MDALFWDYDLVAVFGLVHKDHRLGKVEGEGGKKRGKEGKRGFIMKDEG